MPTDVSHLPPAPTWFHPHGPTDDRSPVVRGQVHLDAGRLACPERSRGSNTPPAPPHVIAQREATAAQFAAYSRDARRLRQEYGQ